MVDSKNLIAAADRELFTDQDLSTVERNFSPNYVEHSPLIANGIPGLKELVTKSGQALRHDVARVLIDGDLVASHGFYPGLAEPLSPRFNIYRIANGEITEHRDGLIEQAEPRVSGCTQLDVPTTLDESANTEGKWDLVFTFLFNVLINQNYDNFAKYTRANSTFHRHRPTLQPGLPTCAASSASSRMIGHR